MRTGVAWVVAGLLLIGGTGLAVADGSKPATRISRDLADLAGGGSATAAAPAVAPDAYAEVPLTVAGNWVTIDAVAATDPALLEAELIALGARDTAIAGRLVSIFLNEDYRPGVYGVAVYYILGLLYFAIAGRNRLVLSPEEEFALTQGERGVPEVSYSTSAADQEAILEGRTTHEPPPPTP